MAPQPDPFHRPRWVLPAMVVAQVFGVSTWFSASAALPSLTVDWKLEPSDGGLLLSAVQLGFILGTLLFAFTNLSDLYRPSRVFLVSALCGAALNLLFAYWADGLGQALALRLLVGVSLAGVYPVGMKIVVSWFPSGIGNALGWVLGALVLGSASPYLLRVLGGDLPWPVVMGFSSLLATLSGIIMVLTGDGPNLPPASRLQMSMLFQVFRIPGYRRAALGYFGHMWELYAMWAITPLLVGVALSAPGMDGLGPVSLWAFLVVGIGAVGSVWGGLLSQRRGSRWVAGFCLACSGAMCVAIPFLAQAGGWVLLAGLLVWGFFVVPDSPQFSALSAQACPPAYVGTALTIQNSIGFAITIFSIEWCVRYWEQWGAGIAWILAPGPVIGLILLNLGAREKAGGAVLNLAEENAD